MVSVGGFHAGVFAEAIIAPVSGMVIGFAFPVAGAFYAEVVVCLAGKFAIAIGRFEYALGQGDTGRYSEFAHLVDGGSFKAGNVLFGCSLIVATMFGIAAFVFIPLLVGTGFTGGFLPSAHGFAPGMAGG